MGSLRLPGTAGLPQEAPGVHAVTQGQQGPGCVLACGLLLRAMGAWAGISKVRWRE